MSTIYEEYLKWKKQSSEQIDQDSVEGGDDEGLVRGIELVPSTRANAPQILQPEFKRALELCRAAVRFASTPEQAVSSEPRWCLAHEYQLVCSGEIIRRVELLMQEARRIANSGKLESKLDIRLYGLLLSPDCEPSRIQNASIAETATLLQQLEAIERATSNPKPNPETTLE